MLLTTECKIQLFLLCDVMVVKNNSVNLLNSLWLIASWKASSVASGCSVH